MLGQAVNTHFKQINRHTKVRFGLLKHPDVSIIMLMDTHNCAKTSDWHPADVKAALEKRDVSLRQLAHQHGYSHFQRVLTSPWWAAEQIVAKALGMKAEEIWPSRYGTSRKTAKQRTRKISVSNGGRIRAVAQEVSA